MENNVNGQNKRKNLVVVILAIFLLAACGFICYDKFLKKDEPIKKDCNCPTCEKCNSIEKDDEKLKICTLDMSGKTALDVYKECGDDHFQEFYRKTVIKNIKVNNKNYELTYFFDGRDEEPDERIIKMYLNGAVYEMHMGIYRNVLHGLSVKNNLLVLDEGAYTDAYPPSTTVYDLVGDVKKDNIYSWYD